MRLKIIPHGTLEDTIRRLDGCSALLSSLTEAAGMSSVSEDALSGLSDLMDCILHDFKASIKTATDYLDEGTSDADEKSNVPK